jgi:uncharacterized protein (AIM24 family)
MLWLRTPGGYEKVVVEEGKTLRLDNKSEYRYELVKMGGIKSALFSGEGIVMQFTGPCEIYVHSRNNEKFVKMITSIQKRK